MRYFQKMLSAVLAFTMCLSVCTFSFADEVTTEAVENTVISENVQDESIEVSQQQTEESATVEETETQQSSEKETEDASESVETVPDQGKEDSVTEEQDEKQEEPVTEELEDKQKNPATEEQDEKNEETAAKERDEKQEEPATEEQGAEPEQSVTKEQGEKDEEPAGEIQQSDKESNSDEENVEDMAKEELPETAEDDVNATEENVEEIVIEVAESEEEAQEEIAEGLEEIEITDQLLTAAPEDVQLTLNNIQNFYLEGDYVQKAYITLPSASYLNLFIRFINTPVADTRATVRFTNANMTSTYLYQTISYANNLAEVSDWFDAGTYCILISIVADNGNNYFPISYSIENKVEATNIEASNGNLSAAVALPADGAYHGGLLSRTSNSRWWKITLTQPGFLEVDVRSFVEGQVASDVYLLRDGQMNRRVIRPLSIVLPAASPTDPEFRYASTWLETGEYYLNVFAKDQKTGEYSVMVTFKAANNTEADNDGTYLNANLLELDGASIRGLMSYTDEVDMFTFTVDDTTNVDVSVAAYLDALNVKLYNANMRTQLADMSASGTGGNMNKAHNHEQRIRLNAGTYILSVSRDPNKSITGVYEARVRSTITIRRVNLTNGLIYTLGEFVTGNITYGAGTPIQYYFHLQKLNPATGEYENSDHLTTSENAFLFKPTTDGTYRILAQVSDGVYMDTWASESFTVKNATGLSVNSVDYDPDPVTVGEPVTITAGIGGGGTVVQTSYEIYRNDGTYIDRVITSGGSGQWIPKAAGVYQVMAVATDGISWAARWGGTFTVNPAPAFAIASVDLSTSGTVKVNNPVTVSTVTVNGTGIQYTYEVYFEGNFVSRTTSASSTYTFRPNAVGKWLVMVVATDGTSWASKWSSEIKAESAPAVTVTVTPDKTTIPSNGSVTFSLSYSGSPSITYTQYQLWSMSPNMKVDEWTGNSNQHTFSIASPGTYRVMAVVAEPWKAAWSNIVTVAMPPAITLTSFAPNKTNCYVNDVVTYTLTYSAGSPIQYHYYVYNSSNAVVYSTVSDKPVFKYQYKYPGTYNVMAVATDGYNWASIWSSSTVTVTSYGALQISSINVEGGNSKVFFEPFTVAPVFSNGQKVKAVFYEIYDATGTPVLLAASGATTAATYTYKPQPWIATGNKTFKVMVVATDGIDWVSKWSDPIDYVLPTTLKVTSVTDNTSDFIYVPGYGIKGMIELGDSVEFKGYTKDGAEIIESEFQVYYNPDVPSASGEMMIDTVNTRNNDSLLMIPSNRGYYRVMYVAFDGITWAAAYSSWIYVDSDA